MDMNDDSPGENNDVKKVIVWEKKRRKWEYKSSVDNCPILSVCLSVCSSDVK